MFTLDPKELDVNARALFRSLTPGPHARHRFNEALHEGANPWESISVIHRMQDYSKTSIAELIQINAHYLGQDEAIERLKLASKFVDEKIASDNQQTFSRLIDYGIKQKLPVDFLEIWGYFIHQDNINLQWIDSIVDRVMSNDEQSKDLIKWADRHICKIRKWDDEFQEKLSNHENVEIQHIYWETYRSKNKNKPF